jgi:hypothetical protein
MNSTSLLSASNSFLKSALLPDSFLKSTSQSCLNIANRQPPTTQLLNLPNYSRISTHSNLLQLVYLVQISIWQPFLPLFGTIPIVSFSQRDPVWLHGARNCRCLAFEQPFLPLVGAIPIVSFFQWDSVWWLHSVFDTHNHPCLVSGRVVLLSSFS